jgi:hypothetical protein
MLDLDDAFRKLEPSPVDLEKHWKLHLNFGAKSLQEKEALFAQITAMTGPLGCKAKLGRNSGQIGKDATIYVGSRDRALLIAREIDKRWGDKLEFPAGDVLNDDCQLAGSVWGRFDVRGGVDYRGRHIDCLQYGRHGVPYHCDGDIWAVTQDKDEALKRKNLEESKAILTEVFGDYFSGTPELAQALALEKAAKPNATWYEQMRHAGQSGIDI